MNIGHVYAYVSYSGEGNIHMIVKHYMTYRLQYSSIAAAL